MFQVLDIVRAAESLALNEVGGFNHPPKSPVDHHENLQKTTTIVMSKHTLNTTDQQQQQIHSVSPQPNQVTPPTQVCYDYYLFKYVSFKRNTLVIVIHLNATHVPFNFVSVFFSS